MTFNEETNRRLSAIATSLGYQRIRYVGVEYDGAIRFHAYNNAPIDCAVSYTNAEYVFVNESFEIVRRSKFSNSVSSDYGSGSWTYRPVTPFPS